MEFLEIATYIFMVACYIILGIVFLGVNTGALKNHSFDRVKRLLAVSAFIEALECSAIVAMILHGADYFLLNKFFVPIAFYTQIFMVTFALLALMYDDSVSCRGQKLLIAPVLVIVVMYIVGYISKFGLSLHVSKYLTYIDSNISLILSGPKRPCQ